MTEPRRLSTRRPDEILAMVFNDNDRILGDRLVALGQNCSIVGASGLGKSRLMLQAAVCNQVEWAFVGLESRRTERPWLFIQAENSLRRLQDDLRHYRVWVGETAWQRVNQGIVLHTLETDFDGFLSLGDEQNRKAIAALNQEFNPAVTVYDCLNNFSATAGDLNNDADMLAALTTLSQLTKQGNPERTPVVLHHSLTGKAGALKAVGYDKASFSRGSKALHGWTRGQINVAQGNESADILVIACGKCSDGKEFAPFAVRLDHKTMIYKVEEGFDLVAWRSEMGRSKPLLITHDNIASLCNGGKTKAELIGAILRSVDCSEATAYRHIQKAEKRRFIRFDKGLEKYYAAG